MPRPSRPQQELDQECFLIGELIRIQNKSYIEASEITKLPFRQIRALLERYDQIIALARLNESAEKAHHIQMANLEAIQKQAWEENLLISKIIDLLNPLSENSRQHTEQEIAESIEELIGGNSDLSPILKKIKQTKKRHSYGAFFKAIELSQRNKELLLKILEKKNELFGLTKDPQISIIQNTEAIAARYWEAAEKKYRQLKSAKPEDEEIDEFDEMNTSDEDI